jgi:hypothetical protein
VLYKDSYQRTLALLGHPDTDYPSFELCHEWALVTVDTLAKEVTNSGKPSLVGSFDLSVSSSETEKSMPVDDFYMLFHAYDTTTNRPIDVINTPDAERWGVAGPPNTGSDRILALGWRGTGDDKRLVIYPPGASGTIRVWYMKTIDHAAGPNAVVQLLDDFEQVLVPAGVALYGMPFWSWTNQPIERQAMTKQALQDPSNPMSLVNVFNGQRALFEDRVYNPFVVHASNRLTSPHAHHQIMRSMNPWR